MCSVLRQGPTPECLKPPPRTVGGVQETQRSQLQTIRIALLPSALVGTLHVPNCARVPKKPKKKKRSAVEPTNAHHAKRNTPPMIGGMATGPTEPEEPTDLLPKKFPKTSCIPILKVPSYTTHLSWPSVLYLHATGQYEDYEPLLSWAQALVISTPDAWSVVLGDLNCNPGWVAGFPHAPPDLSGLFDQFVLDASLTRAEFRSVSPTWVGSQGWPPTWVLYKEVTMITLLRDDHTGCAVGTSGGSEDCLRCI